MSRPPRGPPSWILRQLVALRGWVLVLGCWLLGGLMPRCRGRSLVTPDRLQHGLIVVLPGIEGRSRLNRDIVEGLLEAGLPQAIEIHDWTAGRFCLLYNLMAYRRSRRQAVTLAQRLRQYQQDYPGQPVHLVGHSGGAAIAIFAAEELPADAPVTALVLLGPALSPDYDLSAALQRTTHGIYNLYSGSDRLYLCLGTGVLGTIDRWHGVAAGKTGLREPPLLPEAARDLYRTRLHQTPWRPEMFLAGHPGGHLGWASRRFARDYIAPIVAEDHLPEH